MDIVRLKGGKALSDAEVRMLCKLSQETGNDVLSALMDRTINVVRVTAGKLEILTPPWRDSSWADRNRAHGAAIKDRPIEDRPRWVQELIKLTHASCATKPIPQ